MTKQEFQEAHFGTRASPCHLDFSLCQTEMCLRRIQMTASTLDLDFPKFQKMWKTRFHQNSTRELLSVVQQRLFSKINTEGATTRASEVKESYPKFEDSGAVERSNFRSNVQNQKNGSSENFGGHPNFRSNVRISGRTFKIRKTGHPKISATPPKII